MVTVTEIMIEVALEITLTAGVRVFKAARADSRIGMASPRSLSHSSLMAWAAAACSLATASSALTTCTDKKSKQM